MTTLPNLDDFTQRVLWLTKQIPQGRIATYGQIAFLAGSPRAHRAVGSVLGTQVDETVEVIPWHRVLRASGHIAYKGQLERATRQKQRLLDDGVSVSSTWKCDLSTLEWSPETPYWSTSWDDEQEG